MLEVLYHMKGVHRLRLRRLLLHEVWQAALRVHTDHLAQHHGAILQIWTHLHERDHVVRDHVLAHLRPILLIVVLVPPTRLQRDVVAVLPLHVVQAGDHESVADEGWQEGAHHDDVPITRHLRLQLPATQALHEAHHVLQAVRPHVLV